MSQPNPCTCGSGEKRITCAHPTCDETGCVACLTKCQICTHAGHFCSLHINEVDLGDREHPLPLMSCYRCESESLDDVPNPNVAASMEGADRSNAATQGQEAA